MDIVVTIPKKEYENDDKETNDLLNNTDYVQFWTLHRVPKKLNEGDRVYFVKNNRIESSMRVIEIKTDSETDCLTTGRIWSGRCQIFMDDLVIENINLITKGFQGFRYCWWK